jgi:transcriptional regulator with XRE-family HTH domain
MSGHRKWSEIRGQRTPEQEARIAAGVAAILMGQHLDAVRTGRGLTQTEVARRMGVSQSHVAQVEARADVYLSTLISYVRALGGDLRIEAVFPGEEPVAIALAATSDEQKPKAARTTAS